ncbi:MAG: FAD-dependent oxidoreductase [Pseudorhodoplanes sp.]
MKKRHVEIAGAGFSGLTAAIAFQQRGWSVRVHESSEVLLELGAGLFIWDNGLRVLETIGAYEETINGAHQAPFYETRREGKTVAKNPFGQEHGCRMVTLTRPHIYNAIKNAARRVNIEIITGSRVVRATPEGELLTQKGNRFKADLVIGADGAKSSVRDSLGIPTERKIFADGVLRLLAPRPDEMRGGDWENVLDCWAAPEKSLRCLYVPCSYSEVYLSMMSPTTHFATQAVPVNKELWIDAVPEMAPIIRNLGGQGRYNPYEMTRARDWSVGRVALVGDSAHAMPPTLGQGVGCAMMNALALAAILDEAATIEEGLAHWEKNERPMTDATQSEACNIAETRRLQEGHTINVATEEFATAKHVPTGSQGHAA